MKFSKEFVHTIGLDKGGKTIAREAVRGIITRGRTLLMIHSSKNGDYKFPGGGGNRGETHAETLIREIHEECGAWVTRVEDELGQVVEYHVASERDYDVFKMTSFYYFCRIDRGLNEQNLDPYEKDLGFHPVWVNIDAAIRHNTFILHSTDREPPPWTERETFVLQQIKQGLDASEK